MSNPYMDLVEGSSPEPQEAAPPSNPYMDLVEPAAPPVEAPQRRVNPYMMDDLPMIPGYNAAYPSVETGPSAADYAKSLLLKGPASGAKGMISSTLEGAGAIQATPISKPTERQLRASRSGDIDEVARAEQVAQSQQRLPSSVVEQPLYKAGAALDKWGADTLRPTKGTEFLFDIGSGFGSVGAAIGMSLLSPMGAGLAFVASGAGEAAERAVKAGATPEQIGRASRMGTVAGATDVVDGLLPFMGTPGKIAGLIGKLGAKVVAGAFAEGGQEAVQQLIQNAIEKGIYNPNRDYMHEVGYNALIGAIVGGAAKPVLDKFSGESVQSPPVTKEDLDRVFGGPHAPEPEPTAPTELQPDLTTGPTPLVSQVGTEDLSGGLDNEYGTSGATDFSSRIRTAPREAPAEAPTGQSPIEKVLGTPEEPVDTTPGDVFGGRNFIDVGDEGHYINRIWEGSTGNYIYTLYDPGGVELGTSSDFAEIKRDADNLLAGRDSGPTPLEPTEILPPEPKGHVDPDISTFLNRRGRLTSPAAPEPKTLPLSKLQEQAVGGPIGEPNEGAMKEGIGSQERTPEQTYTDTYRNYEVLRNRVREMIRKGSDDPTFLAFADAFINSDPLQYDRNHIEQTLKFFEESKKGGLPAMNDLGISKEEISAKPGVNVGRLATMLGPSLYGDLSELPKVTIKEVFQNSVDAVDEAIEAKQIETGQITIVSDPVKRTVRIVDNGVGMEPNILATKFLEIAGTQKKGERPKGGFGIAKMVTLFGNKTIDVRTMRDGKIAHLQTTGPQLFEAMENPSKAPKITVRNPTPEERVIFPDGHGTALELTIPETYENSDGEVKKIGFPWGVEDLKSLVHSPLFSNIEVSYNGKVLDGKSAPGIGKHFPLDTFTPLFNVNFKNWGTARVYVSNEKTDGDAWRSNAHFLSNGIWQFSSKIKKDPMSYGGDNVKREFYIDIAPKVKAGQPNYPFMLNRQGLNKGAEGDMAKIAHFVSMMYNHEELAEDAASFGSVNYVTTNPKTGKIVKSKDVKITPTVPQTQSPVLGLKKGDSVTVEDGKLVVNGKVIPELTTEMMAKMTPSANELKVDQDTIFPNQVMIHDNVIVNISDVEKKGIMELGEAKFGPRFHEYLHMVGNTFIKLRNVVGNMGGSIRESSVFPGGKDIVSYTKLLKEAIGVSFDIEYRGVSIKLPFSGMFINPAVPEYTDTLRGAIGMIGTMVHELAHFRVRSHDADFPAEMQRIMINLDAHPSFDFLAFKQEFVNDLARFEDVFKYTNELYSGTFRLEPRGRRFEDASSQQVRDGSVSQPGTPTLRDGESAGAVSQFADTSAADSKAGAGRTEPNSRAEETGTVSSLQGETDKNASALQSIDPEMTVPPAQRENLLMKQAVNKIFQAQGVLGGQQGPPSVPPTTSGSSSATPPAVSQALVMVDKMNWMYKFAYGLERLVDRNPRFEPLRRYAELVRQMFRDSTKIQDFAVRVAKDWRRLPIKQQEGLAALIDDVTNMVYRTPAEIQAGTARHPTRQEFEKLVKQHGVAADGLRVYAAQREFFDKFLEMTVRNAFDEANRVISDPVARQDKIDLINNRWKRLQSRPYFPFLRFGSHFITVKDDTKQTVYFQTYERRGIRSAEALQMAAKKDMLEKIAKNPAYKGYTVDHGTLPENAAPFMGLPPDLLEAVQENLHMTGQQKDAMEQLRYDLSPAASFAHRFQHKNYVKGYSDDFLRAFSRYAFHGARYYGRTKYAWALRAELGKADKYSKTLNDNKAGAVSSYMNDHFYNNILDSTGDFGLLKGAIFLWTFGYSVAGATLNLSQVPIITYPWMAAKFGGAGIGDARAVKALARAATQVSNFYKKGSYSSKHTDFHMRALDYGIRTGRISESQASDLAGLAQSNSLLGIGNNKARRGMQQFVEKGAWFFETAEQINRRITYRAALELAQAHPNSIAVKEAMAKYADEYAKLSTEFNPSDARAIITAVHATEQTQFVYSKTNRPRLMRNRWANAILVFHNYMLNVLQLVGQDKSSVLPRYIIMMLAAGGLMGLPGADDLEDIVNIVGKQFFGKDFKLSHWLREMLNDMVGDKSDVVLHGLARRGFGVPALLDLIGEHPGRGLSRQPGQNVPAPVLDRSKAVGMGRLLPVELGKLVDPGKDVDKTVSEQIQRGSGAIFGIGFNLYKMMQDNSTGLGDPKRWEKVMPRELASLSRAFRAFTEGRERSKGGPNSAATVVPYDVRDTEQMAEIIAMAAGYTPLRVSEKWDQIMADAEVKAKLKFEEDIILKNLHEAMRSENPKEIENAKQSIKDYNNSLPQWAKGYTITGETAYSSMEQRERQRISKESGIPLQRRDVPVSRHIQELFPAAIDVRRVN